eukprot:CAMPEP_0119388432 /NCGR_PEP_ID=MMETSP1334-20130426/104927_1 /TAXON_ID=127549 /ORGANISM="Calcidiscus leptoporus, Strain RCC1130" /LENGTH=109 /DNA_ID=CAMNT_0007410419 /DNA_START=29 /DNA_END=358 /DNA_ORIENTATION=+
MTIKKECERTTCRGVHEDDQENCVLKCQSPECYEQIYAGNELEPGEVDRDRSRKFNTCMSTSGRRRRAPPPVGSPPSVSSESTLDEDGTRAGGAPEPGEVDFGESKDQL